MVSDKKICGILAEQLDDSLIVGIGLNVNTPVAELHRAGLDRPAISMADYADKRFDLEAVYATLCSELEPRLDHAGSHGMNSIHAEWKDADYFTGQTVSLVQSGTFFRGKYLGLADDGRIGIHTEDGPRYFWSGELRKAE
jgi:BirA family biotin operon repressor/biotin-[acetyl-CoA-carboxylase] ligase